MSSITATITTAPETFDESLALCRQHERVIITREDSINSLNCRNGTDRFIERYLGGLVEFPLADLIQFLENDHEYWPFVLDAIEEGLHRLGILTENFEWENIVIEPPASRIKVDLDEWAYHPKLLTRS